jgi:5-oxoprolinase (ATP-hydrolysing) subunit A
VACGWHAGDPATMRDTVALAVEHDVAVGAHPGLPDLLGFGRRVMQIAAADLRAAIVYQAGALEAFLRPYGRSLSHVKPHGALYSMLNADEQLAEAAVDAFFDVMERPVIYWPAGSEDRALLRVCAARGVRVIGEYYPDSRHGADGETVVEHSRAPADLDAVEAAFRRFVEHGEVETIDGGTLEIEAESICVHGDGPRAVAIVDRVTAVLEELGRPPRAATATASEEVP